MFAEVIVDVSNSEVDRIFDYFNPELLSAGHRVLVPFGKREIEGYIIRTKEKTDFDIDKVKNISSAIDKYPVILPEQLELMEYMIKKYHLRYVDTLRLFIPSQMRGGRIKELIKEFAYLNPEFINTDIDEIIKPSAKGQRDIFFFLKENGEEQVSIINKDFSASALRNLVARSIVLIKNTELLRTPYKDSIGENKNFEHTPKQKHAISAITNTKTETFLLHGVTGSGKTEVYMSCISDALKKGKTAIMLVPEISLTPQVLKGLRARFDQSVAILHSGLSAGERYDEWRRLLLGEAKVAVGARSAIFAPLQNLGIIIIDEEHDSSYVSESNPRYSTIEVADFRKSFNSCNLVMGSATPSIESYYRAQSNQYNLIEMSERINCRAMPKVEIVNMCKELYEGNNTIFSRMLERELKTCIDGNNQAMIFINRRGYSSYVMCRSCGYVAKCEQCDVSLVYHKEDNVLKCHYCGNRYNSLDLCPECKSPHIKRGFVGTQQVAEKLATMFPDKKILRMDNDTTQSKDSHAKILSQFANKEASILVGTQMIAKGHDFPDVTLVGIVDADMSLHFSDFRACERTFQLITQVSGRAGRDEKTGKVILQTYTPHHYAYKFAVNHDYKSFYIKESNLRETAKYPPFAKIVRVLVAGEDENKTGETLKNIFDDIAKVQLEYRGAFSYFAAMRSPVKRVQNKYRMQVLMRLVEYEDEIIQKVYSIVDKYITNKVSCFTEINPSSLN